MNGKVIRACSHAMLAFQAPLWLLLVIGFVSKQGAYTAAAFSLGIAMLIVTVPFAIYLQLDIRKLRRQLAEELRKAGVGK